MNTEELITTINEIIHGTTRKKLSRKTFEAIEKNEKVQEYIDEQPKGWHRLASSCCNRDGISEFVLMLAVHRAKTFNLCMDYYSNESIGFSAAQSKELHLYILSYATNLASTSSHHVIIAEKIHSKEMKEVLLMKALEKANEADDYFEIFHCALEAEMEKDKILSIAGTAIRRAAETSLSFNEIERVFNVIFDVKIPFQPGSFLRDELKKMAIIGTAKSKATFAHKKSLCTLLATKEERALSVALSLMSWIRTIEKFHQTTKDLPENNSLRKASEKLSQNK